MTLRNPTSVGPIAESLQLPQIILITRNHSVLGAVLPIWDRIPTLGPYKGWSTRGLQRAYKLLTRSYKKLQRVYKQVYKCLQEATRGLQKAYKPLTSSYKRSTRGLQDQLQGPVWSYKPSTKVLSELQEPTRQLQAHYKKGHKRATSHLQSYKPSGLYNLASYTITKVYLGNECPKWYTQAVFLQPQNTFQAAPGEGKEVSNGTMTTYCDRLMTSRSENADYVPDQSHGLKTKASEPKKGKDLLGGTDPAWEGRSDAVSKVDHDKLSRCGSGMGWSILVEDSQGETEQMDVKVCSEGPRSSFQNRPSESLVLPETGSTSYKELKDFKQSLARKQKNKARKERKKVE
ncbi:hypothetical protein OE88DRAFT_1649197 [Heliocybe sulcata]|uniref:Uncharacterized protein n=1 Tax=Heliocybe sulcata TaxID=5364 RepID=A0A5C3MJJ0_9AGAM|nr:hypothetical protein OE88DRAFT_1649197 [Heliocybe sulcata]